MDLPLRFFEELTLTVQNNHPVGFQSPPRSWQMNLPVLARECESKVVSVKMANSIAIAGVCCAISGRAQEAVSEFGIANPSAQCIGYQEAVDMATLGQVYK